MPFASISMLTAFIATMSLWMFNIVEFLNKDSNTELTLTSTNVSAKVVELSVIKSGSKKSRITDVFLLARSAEEKSGQAPVCLDERQQPLINTRRCDASTGVGSICVKFPVKFPDKIGVTIKDDATDLEGHVDAAEDVKGIELQSNCKSLGGAGSYEKLVKDVLRDSGSSSVCDIFYSIRESSDREFIIRRVQGATIKNCGPFLFPQ